MKFDLARLVQHTVFCFALLGIVPIANANNTLTPPPQQVAETIQGAKRMGLGTLRWFGLRIYDGQLWANAEPQTFNYKRDPAWLELKYARSFDGSEIAKRSIDEITGIGAGTEEQRKAWLTKLTEMMPNVQKGDTLSALHTPGQGIQFFKNSLPLTKLEDPALAEAFMGIWLDPKTSAPEMRRELIGLKKR